MKKFSAVFRFFAAVACFAFFATAYAGDDLRINGDFKGALTGKNIPGWQLVSGEFRRIQIDSDDYAVELAPGSRLVSVPQAVSGRSVKIECEIRGSGLIRLGYVIFDRDGKIVEARKSSSVFRAGGRKSKVRTTLALPADAPLAAVTLETEKHSRVIVADVDAEFTGARVSPQAAVIDGTPVVPLVDGRFYPEKALPQIAFGVTLPAGEDVDFELENPENGYWKVLSFDRNICYISVEHDVDGVWPFRVRKAEFEIKALRKGSCKAVLSNGAGRQIEVMVKVTP